MLLLPTKQSIGELSFQPLQTAVVLKRTSQLHYYLTLNFRDNSIKFSIEQNHQFHRFLKNAVKTLGGILESVSESNDQITLLVSLKASEPLDNFVQRLKIVSARFAKRRLKHEQFAWKTSYEVYGVGSAKREQNRRKVRTN